MNIFAGLIECTAFPIEKIDEFPLRQPIGAASDLAPLLLGSRPLGWVMIAARRPPQGRYDLPRCSGASSNHSKPWLLRYQMVDHSANFSKVNLKTCHGSYGLEFSAKSRECNAENFVSVHNNGLLGRLLKIPNTGSSFVQLKWVGQMRCAGT